MTDYLLQQGREEYYPCLDLVAPIHQDWADRNRLEYVVRRGAVLPDWTGHWDGVELMLDLVQREGTGYVFWLDADTLVVKDCDPRAVMRGYDVAMTRHPGPPEHYNCGVLFLRACRGVVDLLSRMLDEGPGVWPWYQQDLLNRCLAEPHWEGRVLTLPHEWNSTAILGHPESCFIRAWHGWPGGSWARYLEMRKAVGR
jgi:hypothetical protein